MRESVEQLAPVAAQAQHAVVAKDLSLVFQTADTPVTALSDVNLTIARGEFVSFIGPSGCGKTTLMRVIADLERPTAGTMLVNGVSAEPMVVMFAPVNKRDGSENDSLANAKPVAEGGTGCFSVSIATEANIAAVVKCAAELAHGESEFVYAGLTPRACARIAAPALAESPLHFECETIEVRRFAPIGTPNAGNCVFGRVVHVRVDDGLANERMHVDPATLAAVGRLGGSAYVTTRDRFDVARG
jgi:flavin reductase (DIM6/NTAB) family NADH-FMN oxidoreductase RutF